MALGFSTIATFLSRPFISDADDFTELLPPELSDDAVTDQDGYILNIGDKVLIHAANREIYGGFIREINDESQELLIRFYDRVSRCWLTYWWSPTFVQLFETGVL